MAKVKRTSYDVIGQNHKIKVAGEPCFEVYVSEMLDNGTERTHSVLVVRAAPPTPMLDGLLVTARIIPNSEVSSSLEFNLYQLRDVRETSISAMMEAVYSGSPVLCRKEVTHILNSDDSMSDHLAGFITHGMGELIATYHAHLLDSICSSRAHLLENLPQIIDPHRVSLEARELYNTLYTSASNPDKLFLVRLINPAVAMFMFDCALKISKGGNK